MRLDEVIFDSRPSPVEAIYIHVPFCFHKCHYCDFYSIAKQSAERMGRFVQLVLAEADLWRKRSATMGPIRTIFFGGGTPSLLPMDEMSKLLRGLRERFDLSRLEEWTVECNPATVSADYCRMLRESGVDRLSLGAQTFALDELRILERHHQPSDVGQSIALARAAGFKRLNLDLMFAIPGQSMGSWRESLQQAMELKTDHLSCYALTYEANTPITVKKRLGQIQAADEEMELAMLHWGRQRLREGGYRAYEISNYARPGQECQHNLVYWHGGSYMGLGPSGASHVDGHRWRNRPHLGEWESAIEAGEVPAMDVEHLSPRQRAGELAMLELRLAEGIEFDRFQRQSGLDARQLWGELMARLNQQGLLDVNGERVSLTERGINVADAIAAEFLAM